MKNIGQANLRLDTDILSLHQTIKMQECYTNFTRTLRYGFHF